MNIAQTVINVGRTAFQKVTNPSTMVSLGIMVWGLYTKVATGQENSTAVANRTNIISGHPAPTSTTNNPINEAFYIGVVPMIGIGVGIAGCVALTFIARYTCCKNPPPVDEEEAIPLQVISQEA